MWTIKDIRETNTTISIYGQQIPVHLMNYQNRTMPFLKRLKDAWKVLTGEAEAFMWPKPKPIN